MSYIIQRWHNHTTKETLNEFADFKTARHWAINHFEAHAFRIVGYHLTEVHNAPLHAEFFIAKPGAHETWTISEVL